MIEIKSLNWQQVDESGWHPIFRTRNGLRVRIYAVDRKGGAPVVVEIEHVGMITVNRIGEYEGGDYLPDGTHDWDLIPFTDDLKKSIELVAETMRDALADLAQEMERTQGLVYDLARYARARNADGETRFEQIAMDLREGSK